MVIAHCPLCPWICLVRSLDMSACPCPAGASTVATGRCGDLTKWSGSVLDDPGHCHHHAGTRTTEVGGWEVGGGWGGVGGRGLSDVGDGGGDGGWPGLIRAGRTDSAAISV